MSTHNQSFYGHGKLLLSGEYFVMEGALALALPTTVGQSMQVKYRHSYNPKLYWKSLDHTGQAWFEATFELWHFHAEITNEEKTSDFLTAVLQQVRKQNVHFLRDEMDVLVETKLEFPLVWGMGSSSSLIYNIAQWAYVSPFELQVKTFGGSGYDIACAQSMGPIVYQVKESLPVWKPVHFSPPFKENLYLLYLGKKKNTREGIEEFKMKVKEATTEQLNQISLLTKEMAHAHELESFNRAIIEHEKIIAEALGTTPIKERDFADFWGEVKSLGAWGGDFALITSQKNSAVTRDYFEAKGYKTFISFSEVICDSRPDISYV